MARTKKYFKNFYKDIKLTLLQKDDTRKIMPVMQKNLKLRFKQPYFLDKSDNNWDYEKISNQNNQYTIKSCFSVLFK